MVLVSQVAPSLGLICKRITDVEQDFNFNKIAIQGTPHMAVD